MGFVSNEHNTYESGFVFVKSAVMYKLIAALFVLFLLPLFGPRSQRPRSTDERWKCVFVGRDLIGQLQCVLCVWVCLFSVCV